MGPAESKSARIFELSQKKKLWVENYFLMKFLRHGAPAPWSNRSEKKIGVDFFGLPELPITSQKKFFPPFPFIFNYHKHQKLAVTLV